MWKKNSKGTQWEWKAFCYSPAHQVTQGNIISFQNPYITNTYIYLFFGVWFSQMVRHYIQFLLFHSICLGDHIVSVVSF